ncbi:triosephosphate isomerase [Candidatus Saccharibacteria bacterium RAAC3_TM7_1]|nr:triosephosphate isomerase [Candidatus Saccharibacteria bacterium RAAC3_TM7_1]HCZ28199.1 triose-phosphate isomerase [Candidatus Saccharibacteria bacterium]
MNLTIHEASLYVHKLAKVVKKHRNVEVVLAPGMLTLPTLSLQVDRRQFKLAAQNLYWRDEGAFTGEVSAHQLRGLVDYAIIGHSERRHIFNENNKDIRAKVQAAVRHGIIPILCVGETAHERSENETAAVLHDQIIAGVANLTSEELRQAVIAYEPVWAIGSGNNALPKDVEMIIGHIRRQIEHLYGKEIAKDICVLYGGSVSPGNASNYLTVDGIDGLLIGGASLQAEAFSEMVEQAFKANTKG